jgi:hypothetical protein
MNRDHVSWGAQIGQARQFHQEGSPVTVTALELKPGHPFADKCADPIAVEIRPGHTCLRSASDQIVILDRSVWNEITKNHYDTWK